MSIAALASTLPAPVEEPADPAQQAVDSAPGAEFAQNVSAALNDMLAPLVAALSQGHPPEVA
ncbi:hypothetical protein, partial [Serratia fonticola]|uniref:hypothetical protein n=1 Tax=Serratia fonticola TaxID=47917 RepID=UPI00301D0A8A